MWVQKISDFHAASQYKIQRLISKERVNNEN